MKFSQSDSDSINRVRAYDASSITIQGTTYHQSLIVAANQIISPWPVQVLADVSLELLQPVAALQADIWLLGTGPKHVFPSKSIRQFAQQQAVGLESMSTSAACRTFNILLAESRNVVALLMLDPEADTLAV